MTIRRRRTDVSSVPRGGSSARQQPSRFETTYNSSDAKDVTVHLEADVFVNLDDELECFNRLMRLGDLKSAKAFFDSHLGRHITNPSVFVQYAEVLLEMDDYKSILALDASIVGFGERDDGGGNETDWQTPENEWRLIWATAMFFSQEEKDFVLQHTQPSLDELLPVTESLSSTGV